LSRGTILRERRIRAEVRIVRSTLTGDPGLAPTRRANRQFGEGESRVSQMHRSIVARLQGQLGRRRPEFGT
jgi:hypothetical protein